jgi:hypothetical protein
MPFLHLTGGENQTDESPVISLVFETENAALRRDFETYKAAHP